MENKSELKQLQSVLNEVFGQMSYEMAETKLKFPKGLRWRYYRTPPKKGFSERYFCWSTTRNANNKFISWVYVWKGKKKKRVASFKKVIEHRKRNKAKDRAHRLYSKRLKKLEIQ